MVATHSSDEALERRKAVTAEINRIPLREVMENLFGFRGKKGRPEHAQIRGFPRIPPQLLDHRQLVRELQRRPDSGPRRERPQTDRFLRRHRRGDRGPINPRRPVRFQGGPGRIAADLSPPDPGRRLPPERGDRPGPPRASPPPENESPKELPARFNTVGEYLQSTRATGEEPVIKLLVNLEQHVYRYLTVVRRIPEAVATGLMARNAAYPSVRERRLVSRRTGRPYCLAEPMVVFPLSSWREDFAVGYDYKTLPTEPAYASFAASEGRKKFGGYQVGRWDENTRHVILTEAALDGISKWVLERPPQDTCIWGMSGARTSDILIAECGQRGIDIRTAFDNDRAGRLAAAATPAAMPRIRGALRLRIRPPFGDRFCAQ